MPGKGPAPKRPVIADPVYNSPVVSQLVNKILLDGKKDLAQRIVYGALAAVETALGAAPGHAEAELAKLKRELRERDAELAKMRVQMVSGTASAGEEQVVAGTLNAQAALVLAAPATAPEHPLAKTVPPPHEPPGPGGLAGPQIPFQRGEIELVIRG